MIGLDPTYSIRGSHVSSQTTETSVFNVWGLLVHCVLWGLHQVRPRVQVESSLGSAVSQEGRLTSMYFHNFLTGSKNQIEVEKFSSRRAAPQRAPNKTSLRLCAANYCRKAQVKHVTGKPGELSQKKRLGTRLVVFFTRTYKRSLFVAVVQLCCCYLWILSCQHLPHDHKRRQKKHHQGCEGNCNSSRSSGDEAKEAHQSKVWS